MEMEFDKNNYAKILVAAPISDVKDYVLEEWMAHISQLTYPNFEILLVDNSMNDGYINKFKHMYPNITFQHVNPRGLRVQDFIMQSQNKIRKYFLDHNFAALMSIECDVFPQLDIIEELFKEKAPVATAFYGWGFGKDRRPLIQISNHYHDALRNMDVFRNENLTFDEAFRFIDGTSKKVFSCGLGCALIQRPVLVHIPYRTDEDTEHHADTYYMVDVYDHGFYVICNTRLWAGHKNQPWVIQDQIIEKKMLE